MLNFGYFHLIAIGAGISILAQLGDLSESLIKRDCQVKDSGSAFPGMGGVLDQIDSLLFTAPVFYFYMSVRLLK
jgi:phosphatidate cytidylyltransferase